MIGLLERLPGRTVIVYTSSQGDTREYDQRWLEQFGVLVLRDKAKILLPTPRVIRAVKSIIRENGLNNVFFGAAAPLGICSRSLRKAGAQNIVALTHGHEVWWSKIWPFKAAIKFMGNNIDHLTYLGDYTRGEISKSLSDRATNALVKIAPGIDSSHFKPQPESEKLRESLGLANKQVIVSVGRLVHRKGQDILIRALPSILKSDADAHLLLIGEGPYEDHLKRLVSKLGLTDSVTFVGRVQYADLPLYFCAGDLFAMPSRSRLAGLEVEGLGIVYLEASSCGLAVIAGKSGGAPDAVIEGETGVTVDGRDPNEVASAVTSLLSDPHGRKEMGRKGREWIIQNWSSEKWSNSFNRILIKD